MTTRFLTLSLISLAALALPAEATTVTLNPLSSPVAGSSFDVEVRVTDVFSSDPTDAIAAFGFNVLVGNSSVLTYDGETPGSLFTDLSGVFGPSPMVAGVATAGFLAFGDFSEPLVLATLHFSAKTPGVSSIMTTTDLNDLNQGLFYLNAGNTSLNSSASVSVAAASTTPEPSAMILGSLAMAGLLSVQITARRRRTSGCR
jgi:hypothetical protein